MFNYNETNNNSPNLISSEVNQIDETTSKSINEQHLDLIKEEYNNLQEYLNRLKVLTRNLNISSSIITQHNMINSQEEQNELIDEYKTLYKYIYRHIIGMDKIMKTLQEAINNNISVLIQLKEDITQYDEFMSAMNNEDNNFEQTRETYERTIEKVNSFNKYNPVNLQELGLLKNLDLTTQNQNIPTTLEPKQNIINLQNTFNTLKKINSDFTTHLITLPYTENKTNIINFDIENDLDDDFIIKKNKFQKPDEKESVKLDETLNLENRINPETMKELNKFIVDPIPDTNISLSDFNFEVIQHPDQKTISETNPKIFSETNPKIVSETKPKQIQDFKSFLNSNDELDDNDNLDNEDQEKTQKFYNFIDEFKDKSELSKSEKPINKSTDKIEPKQLIDKEDYTIEQQLNEQQLKHPLNKYEYQEVFDNYNVIDDETIKQNLSDSSNGSISDTSDDTSDDDTEKQIRTDIETAYSKSDFSDKINYNQFNEDEHSYLNSDTNLLYHNNDYTYNHQLQQNNIYNNYNHARIELFKIHSNNQITDYVVTPTSIHWGEESMKLFRSICENFNYDNKEMSMVSTTIRVKTAFYELCNHLLPQVIYCYVIDENINPPLYKLLENNDKMIISNAFEEVMMLYLSNDKYFESNKHIDIIQTWNILYPELTINIF